MAKVLKDKKLKILIVAAELAPYASVGGLSRVIPQLARALRQRGHDVRIFMPKFGLIDEEKYPLDLVMKGLRVSTDFKQPPYLVCNVKSHQLLDSLPVYFLENQEYYEKRANVYGYSDDPRRWALLCRGVLEFVKNSAWVPDIIHANDWHTGIISNYLKTVYKNDKKLSSIVSVFTIHNLAHQGMFDHRNVSEMDFDDGRSEVSNFFSKRLNKLNFLKRGVIYSDVINTVSEKYALEILTPEYGEGLDQLLLELRLKLSGIVNGIDVDEFDPETDPLIPENYNCQTLAKRETNKLALQKKLGLPKDKNIALAGLVSRLDWQKGVKLISEKFSGLNCQFVFLGTGQAEYEKHLKNLAKKYPDKFSANIFFNLGLAQEVYAGADIFMMPSRFEPCGLGQMIAMRYGTVPVVRNTGGLSDTVNGSLGFKFNDFSEEALYKTLKKALNIYYNKPTGWKKMQKKGMRKDFSWDKSAREYLKLYKKLLGKKY